MKKNIESKTILKGLVGQILSYVSLIALMAIIIYLSIANPGWSNSEDYSNVWIEFGPIVRWIGIISCSIALISLSRILLGIIIYGDTQSLSINLNDNVLTFTTSHKSFFGFSCEESTIAHKLLSVNVTQGYFGKLYDTGTITIKVSAYNNAETEEHEFSIDGVESPFSLKATIQETLPIANDKLNIKEA